MKEVLPTDKDQVAEARQVRSKKKMAFVGNVKKGDGHKLYEYNSVTLELKPVKQEEQKNAVFVRPEKKKNEVYLPHDPIHIQLKMKENCTYLYALNEKNAIKKIIKLFNPPHIKLVDE